MAFMTGVSGRAMTRGAARCRRQAVIWAHGALALLAALLGGFVAAHHPLWSVWLPAAFVVWCVAVCRRPVLWLFVLPALLPVAGFSVWTGWIGVEEFDLLALGAVAGCQARRVVQQWRWPPLRPSDAGDGPALAAELPASVRHGTADRRRRLLRMARIALLLMTLSYLLALGRGLVDSGGLPLGWFQAYEDPLNSLRVAKGFLLVLLLLPSLRSLLYAEPQRAAGCLAAGVATGLGWVALAVAGERAGYPGLFEFSTPYRSTAWFWEMHVGGAGLDGFLALAVPFAAYAVVYARTPLRWALASLLAVAAGYACLTTFSRGVYLAVGLSLIVLACLLRRPARRAGEAAPAAEPWRVHGNRALLLVLIIEVLAVLGFGDFMSSRLAAGERDLGGRLEHWRESLSLLDEPVDFLLGRGLGRFPANYSRHVPGREMPGRLHFIDDGKGSHLRLSGPRNDASLSATFELVQRLREPLAGRYALGLDLRAPQPATLRLSLCQKHLLYAAWCTEATVVVPPGGDEWRHYSLALKAHQATAARWQVPVPGFFSLRLHGPADFVEVDNLRLVDASGQQLLANGDFAEGSARWFFAARHYFLPWHVDSLFLETLIDQGALGLLLLLALLILAFANLRQGPGRKHFLAPYLLAALVGGLAVGVFSSLLDMPRSAFLFHLLLCSALFLGRPAAEEVSTAAPAPPRKP